MTRLSITIAERGKKYTSQVIKDDLQTVNTFWSIPCIQSSKAFEYRQKWTALLTYIVALPKRVLSLVCQLSFRDFLWKGKAKAFRKTINEHVQIHIG